MLYRFRGNFLTFEGTRGIQGRASKLFGPGGRVLQIAGRVCPGVCRCAPPGGRSFSRKTRAQIAPFYAVFMRSITARARCCVRLCKGKAGQLREQLRASCGRCGPVRMVPGVEIEPGRGNGARRSTRAARRIQRSRARKRKQKKPGFASMSKPVFLKFCGAGLVSELDTLPPFGVSLFLQFTQPGRFRVSGKIVCAFFDFVSWACRYQKHNFKLGKQCECIYTRTF